MLKANISGEIIVSDNGSTDQSVQVAIAHAARVVHATKKAMAMPSSTACVLHHAALATPEDYTNCFRFLRP